MSNALKALKANRLKTSLIFLSLIFSITSIFLISSISNGIISMYSSILKSDGDIIVTQSKISDTFFSNVDIKLIEKIKKSEAVKDVSAIVVGASPVEELPIVAIYGITENRFKNYKLSSGNYPKDNQALLGQSIYEKLQNKKEILIANKKFQVSGVFKSDIGFEDGGVFLNISDAGEIFNKSASMIMINTKINSNIEEIVSKIKTLHNDIDVKTTSNFVDNYNQFKIIKTSSNLVSFISFCMGLLGIVSIMSITINQRQSEFGIKRAIGISMKKIVFQIISESFILGFFSFVCSFFLSEILLYAIRNIAQFQGYVDGKIDTSLAIYVFVASIILSIVGAIIPSLNAAKTDPIILIQGNKI